MEYTEKIVIKIGSSQLIEAKGVNAYEDYAKQVSECLNINYFPIMVSSGAVATGMKYLEIKQRPTSLRELRALAAIGQSELMDRWKQAFAACDLKVAQVLLNHHDLKDRASYLNIRSTLQKLIELKVIPIINENDSVADEELRYGDNDQLAGAVASLIEAEKLVIFTNVDGILNAKGEVITKTVVSNPLLKQVASGSSHLGSGGMITKLKAAELAAQAGVTTHIINGEDLLSLQKVLKYELVGTTLVPDYDQPKINARKRWIDQQKPQGHLVIDTGAETALSIGASLLAVGVIFASRDFSQGSVVAIRSLSKQIIAKGIINIDSITMQKFKGKTSAECAKLSSVPIEDEIINRDNLLLCQ